MSNIIPDYMVKPLPKSFTTYETQCKMVQDYVLDDETGKPLRDEHGQRVKKGPARMVRDDMVESKGGIEYTFPNGNSLRMSSQDQLDLFGLTSKPRLIDTGTGEEVDERGIPLSLAALVTEYGAVNKDTGLVGTEPVEDDE